MTGMQSTCNLEWGSSGCMNSDVTWSSKCQRYRITDAEELRGFVQRMRKLGMHERTNRGHARGSVKGIARGYMRAYIHTYRGYMSASIRR